MFLKNFFGEKIYIENINEIESELKERYGLAKEHQRICKIGDHVFILMHPQSEIYNEKTVDDTFLKKLGDLEELGIPSDILGKISKIDENQRASFVKYNILPYIFDNASESVVFNKIQKTGIDNIDEYIKTISPCDRNTILKNIDSYIGNFLNFDHL